jgi:hypothetical protein
MGLYFGANFKCTACNKHWNLNQEEIEEMNAYRSQ